MPKILSQAGISLADVYDVQGSIAGVEELSSGEVSLVHEMGATIFSERLSHNIRRSGTGAILQSVNFNLVINDLPAVPTRLLGVAVFSDNAVRVLHAAILARSAGDGREIPIWVYDQVNFLAIRMEDAGGGVADHELLLGNVQATMLPTFVGGNEQPQIVNELAFRGTTTAFGAGDVTITALYYTAFSQVGGLSSRGLPIPSW